jgi:DNA polymerase-3 subunit delta'
VDIFNDIVGQDKALSFLKNNLEHGTTGHAYLFTGPDGVGKRATAVRLAAALNCPDGGCGACASCAKVAAGSHPDVQTVSPTGNTLKIDQVRELARAIGLKPFEGEFKVYVVEDAHLMTTEAANALLKNLEEPPGYVVFVLTAPGADGLLPTIVSRCQEVAFTALRPTTLMALLTSEGASADRAEIAAALAGGSVAKAKRLASDNAAGDVRAIVLDRIEEIGRGSVIDCFEAKEALQPLIKEHGKDGGLPVEAEALEIMSSWYRDIVVYQATHDDGLLINRDRRDAITNAAAGTDPAAAAQALEILTKTGQAMRTNANKELLLEYALLAVNGVFV